MGDRQTPTIHPSLSGMHTYSSAKHVLMPIICQFFLHFCPPNFVYMYTIHMLAGQYPHILFYGFTDDLLCSRNLGVNNHLMK